ncbi:hypothetical protein [Sphingobacterium sp. ML3W]|uniref:hypothetical protein n=1 Tax=Sphingobacterium sp. ML3W TaxID=1538644 RepID=UPI00249C3D8D|nr:hypothetical protein [Sphingobacterium sp. ML3W]WFA79667.1 hypothetical protein OGI71_26985 [Sphingobacterium sp. ML3W]
MWWKVDSEANWNANDLILGPGEPAWVVNTLDQGVNVKVGNGEKKFSELPYFIEYDQAAYVNITGTALPSASGVGYSIVPEGTYTRAGQSNVVVPTGQLGILYKDGTTWSLGSSVALPQATADGNIALGETKAPNGDKTYKAIQPLDKAINGGESNFGLSAAIETYTITDTNEYVDVNILNGSLYSGAIEKINVRASKIGQIRVNLFQDETPTGASLKTLRNMVEVTLDCTTVGVNTFVDGTHFNNITTKQGWLPGARLIAGGALPYRIIRTGAACRYPSTSVPVVGATANMAVHDIEFAIEFVVKHDGMEPRLYDAETNISSLQTEVVEKISEDDFTFTESVNIANPANKIAGSYIDSAGNIQTGSGWEMIKIDTSKFDVGQEITFGNITISTGHCAWYNGTTKILYGGSYNTGNLPKTVLKPANGNILYITIMRSNISNPSVMVNKGATLLPYQPFQEEKIDKIKGYPLAGSSGSGGNTFDQSLNTTDSVRFAFITGAGARFERPVWDEVSPTTVQVGDEYVFPDGNGNYFNKTRGV